MPAIVFWIDLDGSLNTDSFFCHHKLPWASEPRNALERKTEQIHNSARDGPPASRNFLAGCYLVLHDGKLVLFVNGVTTTQSFGTGGIDGGGMVLLGGVNSVSAAPSNVLFVEDTVPQPPPFQNPDWEPSGLVSVAVLLLTITGPHADEYWFHTIIAVLPPPVTGVRFNIRLLLTTWFVPLAMLSPHCPVSSSVLFKNWALLEASSAITPQPDLLCPPVM